MKCENCRFLRYVSSETESYSYCPIFGEDIPYPFINASYDGCAMTFQEAKKLNELNNEAESLRYEHIGKWYELEEKGTISEEENKQLDKLGQELDFACKIYNNYFSIVKNRMKVKWNQQGD